MSLGSVPPPPAPGALPRPVGCGGRRVPAAWGASLLLLALLSAVPAVARAGMVGVGEPAPPLRARDLAGRAVVVGEGTPHRAQLVMFSSIGCVPCRESEPVLAAADRDLGDRLDAACVMLAEPAAVRAMLAAAGEASALPFYADTAGDGLFPLASAYGVMGTPTTFLIGRAGGVLWRHVGRLTPQNLEQDIPGALEGDGGASGVAFSRPLPAPPD